MLYQTKIMTLKNGRSAIFRAPDSKDATEMMDYLKTIAGETDFILRYPEECTETPEQEAKYLQGLNDSPYNIMIVCEICGKIAGNCQLSFKKRMKVAHRASVAIALKHEYWNLGIGTAMFNEMIEIAKQYGATQLELEFIEGNERAKHLYEKMGFRIVAEKPNAIRLRDGTMLKEYFMIKIL
ncbi:MAG: GNAT family N-acetyltransferase [Clostridiales bacterium]|nr:GNAT family N-acetyltransferase [Clostridiales bacterium]